MLAVLTYLQIRLELRCQYLCNRHVFWATRPDDAQHLLFNVDLKTKKKMLHVQGRVEHSRPYVEPIYLAAMYTQEFARSL